MPEEEEGVHQVSGKQVNDHIVNCLTRKVKKIADISLKNGFLFIMNYDDCIWNFSKSVKALMYQTNETRVE